MKLRSIKYYFSEAFKSVIRNRLMSVTSILTVASCILILVFSYCIAVNVDYILMQLENTVPISAYIDDDVSADKKNELYNKILALDNVDEENTKFVSKKEALQTMIEKYGDNSEILKGLEEENPLRDSFKVALISSRDMDNVISELNKMMENNEGIAKVVHAKDIIDKLVTVNNIVRIVSIIIVLVLGLLSVIIIMNTIKLTVNSRRNDISIMKYVGATDWFIKWPFVIEGMIIGVVGAIIPVSVIALLYGNVIDVLTDTIAAISNQLTLKNSYEVFPSLFPIVIILGLFIGAMGSMLSMQKYLDV